MYRHILVPVDGSDTSNLALREAITLAKENQSELRVVTVVDTTSSVRDWWELTSADMERYHDAMRRYGRDILAKAEEAARDGGIKAATKMIEIRKPNQRIASLIVEEAKSWPADLIVIGTHGRRGLDHLLIGSVAEGVIRLSFAPVLLIRGKKEGG